MALSPKRHLGAHGIVAFPTNAVAMRQTISRPCSAPMNRLQGREADELLALGEVSLAQNIDEYP
jgi:hypothetical protein